MLLRAADAKNRETITALQARVDGFSEVRTAMVKALGLDAGAAQERPVDVSAFFPAGPPSAGPPPASAVPLPPPHPAAAAAAEVVVPATPVKEAQKLTAVVEPVASPLVKPNSASPDQSEPLEAPDDEYGGPEDDGDPGDAEAVDSDASSEALPMPGSEKVVLQIRVSSEKGVWHEIYLNDLGPHPRKQLLRNAPGSGRRPIERRLESSSVIKLRMATRRDPIAKDNDSGKAGRLPSPEMWKLTPELEQCLLGLRRIWAGGSRDGAIGIHVQDVHEGQLSGFLREMNTALRGGWTDSLNCVEQIQAYVHDKLAPTVVGTITVEDSDDSDNGSKRSDDADSDGGGAARSEADPIPTTKRKGSATVTYSKRHRPSGRR